MNSKWTTALTVILAAIVLFLFPAQAHAQREMPRTVDEGSNPRDRERYRDPDPRVNDRSDIPALRSPERLGDNADYLYEAVSRISSRSKNFQKYLSASAESSAPGDAQSVDRVNEEIRILVEMSKALKKQIGGNHALASGRAEANRLLDSGTRVDEFVSQKVSDKRTGSEWKKIRQDLRVVAHMYGFRQSIFYNAQ